MELNLYTLCDPFADLRKMERQVFDDALMRSFANKVKKGVWDPKVDISENDQRIAIHAELPGVKKEDVQVDVSDGVLTLSGEKCEEKKVEKERYHRVERNYGKFSRHFALPIGMLSFS
jgi:HSP20 family protein